MKVSIYEASDKILDMLKFNFDIISSRSKISGLHHIEIECSEIRVYENYIEIFNDGNFKFDGVWVNPGACKIEKDEFSELVI